VKHWAHRVFGRRKPKPPVVVAPKVIVFDFDGTLADTFDIAFEIVNKLAEEFHFRKLTREEVEHARDMRTRELMKYLGVSPTKLSRIGARGTAALHSQIDRIVPLPGIPELVRELHRRQFALGIITSNSEDNVRTFLRNHDLDLFQFIRSSSKLLGKAREIRQVMKTFRFGAGDMLFIGDETRDIEAAHKAGIPIAAVSWGYNSRRSLENMKPGRLYDRAESLLDALKKPGEVMEIPIGRLAKE